jgi:hypothetical protein
VRPWCDLADRLSPAVWREDAGPRRRSGPSRYSANPPQWHDLFVRRPFWPLIFLSILLASAAAACLTVAYINRNYESSEFWDRLIRQRMQMSVPGIDGRDVLEGTARALEDPLPWLVAGVLLALLAALALGLAARRY